MELYRHQKEGLEKSKDLNKVAYYWDMGTGKTFIGSEKMKQLRADLNIVVCQKSKVNDWVKHIDENYNYHVFDLTNKKQYELFFISKQFHKTVGVINYDLVWRKKELLNLDEEFTLLLDESSLIQNETAKRTKFILRMKPKNVILLSGTPTGGKYERLWSQLHLLGWDISRKLYWDHYVKVKHLDLMNGRSVPIVVGYKNVERLKSKMSEYGCQFLKTNEVFDLPVQTFTKISVPITKEYKKFKKDRIVKIGDTELVGDTTLNRMLYERELCSIYNDEKIKAFEDLLDSTEDRFIVFYNFTKEMSELVEVVKAHGRKFGIVNGQIKAPDALNEEGAVLFVQYQAGAMGLNLQLANKIIYYSLPLSSELFEQSKKRIHRIGQELPCFYYELICKNSIEEKILKTLEMRKDYTLKLFEKEDEN